jgi:hypothetical protein
MDILGVHLGATHAEALAALDKIEPKLIVESFFNVISDGVMPMAQQARAGAPGAFVTSMAVNSKKPGADRVTIMFALPPNENRVVEVRREQVLSSRDPENALSPAVLWKALDDKYGAATEKGPLGNLGMRGKWLHPAGATDCIEGNNYWNAMNGTLPPRCASAFTVDSTQGYDGLVIGISSRLANPRVVKDCYDRYIKYLQALRAEREHKQLENAKGRPQL